MTDKKQNVAIIGAGPAGLTAAYELAKAGIQVEVFEASDSIGGMSKTINLWGQLVDLGPHRFFSTDKRINKLWLEVVGNDYALVNRLTRIYYKRTFFNYPLEAFNALRGLGIFEATRCVCSYFIAKISPKKSELNFETWVVDKFGRRLFEIFFKSYSEKLWGIKCDQLDADFATQRIKKLSLFEAVKDALFKSKGKHKSLIDEFYYPLKGTGMVYDKMAARIVELGGVIHLSTPASGVAIKSEDEVTLKLQDGRELDYTHLVSSMPLTALVKQLDAPEEIKECARKLTFRNTILVYIEVAGTGHFPDQWIYVHASDLRTGRITNFSNWVPSINGDSKNTIICMEYWSNTEDEMWNRDEDTLIEMAKKEAYATTLIPQDSIIQGKVIKIPNSYPVYARNYKQLLQPIQHYLSQFKNLMLIGRYGAFKYNNQDHSILMGLLAAEKIINDSDQDLWSVNTDDEYQEIDSK